MITMTRHEIIAKSSVTLTKCDRYCLVFVYSFFHCYLFLFLFGSRLSRARSLNIFRTRFLVLTFGAPGVAVTFPGRCVSARSPRLCLAFLSSPFSLSLFNALVLNSLRYQVIFFIFPPVLVIRGRFSRK